MEFSFESLGENSTIVLVHYDSLSTHTHSIVTVDHTTVQHRPISHIGST